ncbi:MAG TPA: tRNA-dihydrouridine synthase [Anaerohalosphaeraceae bacterium]|nr:tRNA-dihydrouridine synthase [Anaerohalosphaeraceae bacterium]HOL32418.1 tRNA-dihydrouridine synthase [Anaerohalosphaeraceae bacterium]HOM75973.1 tRNA-dihydrouridine synthase [Anaerohalosphaeraceae bacterium]HPC62985.1 tRNA-dihydrouridine synthase [Anaerohalosphaeraceae bacterium]HPO70930.1 tRNA-dihydrouridine synthase [Anaerohalosphaeraceae bacterium]
MLTFGSIQLDMPFIQAPLSGYTDYPMRILARRFGCPLTFTGVMLDKIALHHKALRKAKFQPQADEHPVGAQLLGDDPEVIAQAACKFIEVGYDLIDLNFACPAPKVLRRARGGYRMQQPEFIRQTFRLTRQLVKTPVFMKIRIGYDSSAASEEDFWTICRNAAEDGVDMLAIHGRTVVQKYKGKADWSRIIEAKKRFGQLTIFGSGDVLDAETAVQRLAESGLDGVIIARGAVGNPWIFQEIRALFSGQQKPPSPSLAEQGQIMLEHFEMICQSRPERKAVPYFRKFLAGYCRRHPERKKVLLALMACKSRQAVIDTIRQLYCLH